MDFYGLGFSVFLFAVMVFKQWQYRQLEVLVMYYVHYQIEYRNYVFNRLNMINSRRLACCSKARVSNAIQTGVN